MHDKLESIQYNACLAITGAIRGASTEKVYQEFGLVSLKFRRWFRKLFHFNRIFNEKSASYLFSLIPNFNRAHNTRFSYNIAPIKVRHDYFNNSFFPSAITEWNKRDPDIGNSASLNTFKKKLLNFIRPCPNSICDIHHPLWIKLLTRLRIGLSHLHEHKLGIAFKIHWILYANVAKTLNQQCISFSATLTFSFLNKPSFRKLQTLTTAFSLKVKRN